MHVFIVVQQYRTDKIAATYNIKQIEKLAM